MQRLLRMAETPPFGWEQVAPGIPRETIDGARGALGGNALILTLDSAATQRYSAATEDVQTVGNILAESEFLGGIASGLVRQGLNNNWLARELAGYRPSEAYRLGVFAGATAIGTHLDVQGSVLDDAIHEEIRAMAAGMRDEEDVQHYRKPDRPKVLELAKRAKRDMELRSVLTGAAVDELMVREFDHEADSGRNARALFREFLASRTEARGRQLGRQTGRRLFESPSMAVDGGTLSDRLERASSFVHRIVGALPPKIYDLPAREQYNRGVRRALAFVAMAAAEPNPGT